MLTLEDLKRYLDEVKHETESLKHLHVLQYCRLKCEEYEESCSKCAVFVELGAFYGPKTAQFLMSNKRLKPEPKKPKIEEKPVVEEYVKESVTLRQAERVLRCTLLQHCRDRCRDKREDCFGCPIKNKLNELNTENERVPDENV